MTFHHDELLPFGVVPMLAFGDAGLADIDAHLATVEGVDQLGKRATVIYVHLQRESHFLLREIREIRGVQLLGEAVTRDFWYHQGLRLSSETLKQIYYFT